MEKNDQLSDLQFSKSRNRKKIIRTILQIIILCVLVVFVVYNVFYTTTYTPYTEHTQDEKGFIAISYFGVQRTAGSQQLISQDRLRRHLAALKKQGYETITTEDIYNYYTKGIKLPDKAVYLMFEDGRRDTAIFAKPELEDFNYKATIFTYPNKFSTKDPKFLSPDDLKRLTQSSYWELGTNGYRLYYINVFDRYNNYLGEMNPLMFAMLHKYLGRRYNHYLMDYIRDKYGVPKESYARMKDRVSYDYEKLESTYMNDIGYVPSVSILMHANTGSFGNNSQVSGVNAYWLKKLFKMNFNREGYCLNKTDSSIYDLTRMQPQAWWPANHLLMRIEYDTHQKMKFETGDKKRAAQWDLLKGACEFIDEKIYLTSLPQGQGIIKLKRSNAYKNFKLDVELMGNKKGTQEILLRSDEQRNNYIALTISGRELIVKEKHAGTEKELVKKSLDNINGVPVISIPEDQHDAKERALETFSRYAESTGLGKVYLERLKTENKKTAPTVKDGAKPYIPVINANEKGDEKISLTLQGNILKIMVNGKDAITTKVNDNNEGNIFLLSQWSGHGFDQRNLADDVYDAVFNKLTITNLPNKNILFTSKYTGFNKVIYDLKIYGEKLVGWFVKYL
ncbi:polysaccharide deacetylase family protein [Pectinatus sottacetonis]|uniref:polysaccharide deacetylase family protein n=1 Tax=Pectinatus sottacetonis TaxID=1002795 RepID=UPI0018C50AFE|nr:polysaccharide deacetylase family protein [Pectinatus sottacetonis]